MDAKLLIFGGCMRNYRKKEKKKVEKSKTSKRNQLIAKIVVIGLALLMVITFSADFFRMI